MFSKYLRPSYNGGADEQSERALARIADLEEEYENLEAARDREVAKLARRVEELIDEREFWVRQAAGYRDEADYIATEWAKLRSERAPMGYVVVYRTAADARIKRQLTHHMREMRRIHG